VEEEYRDEEEKQGQRFSHGRNPCSVRARVEL
jgi:hypothetical protein